MKGGAHACRDQRPGEPGVLDHRPASMKGGAHAHRDRVLSVPGLTCVSALAYEGSWHVRYIAPGCWALAAAAPSVTSGSGARGAPGFLRFTAGFASRSLHDRHGVAGDYPAGSEYCMVSRAARSGEPRSQRRMLSSSVLMRFASCARILMSLAGRQSTTKTLYCTRSP